LAKNSEKTKKWKRSSRIRYRFRELQGNARTGNIYIKQVLAIGRKTALFTALSLLLLLLIDLIADNIYTFLEYHATSSEQGSVICWFWTLDYRLNEFFPVKDVSQLAYGITIGASVLGVLLGLFFTTFLTIVSTRYANISSTIRTQLLEQPIINYYFTFLTVIISTSFLFQFTLIIGYQPTIISCILLALFIVIAISSFVGYGKISLIFYDLGYLVIDLIQKSEEQLENIRLFRSDIDSGAEGRNYLGSIYSNLDKIDKIVEEARNPQLTNTSLDEISSMLLEFSITYNAVKSIIPARKGWHIEVMQAKKWENAQQWDLSILRTTGVDMIPQRIDDFNFIEKKISSIQFRLFNHYVTDDKGLMILAGQSNYLAQIAGQYDVTLFEHYIDLLEKFMLQKVVKNREHDEKFEAKIVQLFSYLMTTYLYGANNHIMAINTDQLKKTAEDIHKCNPANDVYRLPYSMMKWVDEYQQRLLNEKKIVDTAVTPLFYTEYLLVATLADRIIDFWDKVIVLITKRLSKITAELSAAGLNKQALQFVIGFNETHFKANVYLSNAEQKIREFNKLNWQKKNPVSFINYQDIEKKNQQLQQNVIDQIWALISKVHFADDDEEDIQGHAYQLISGDLISKIFHKDASPEQIAKYLGIFLRAAITYIEDLRKRYAGDENWINNNVRLLPLIMDILQLNALAICVGKIFDNSIVDHVIDIWDKLFTEESERTFWAFLYTAYEIYNQPQFGLSTNAYQKEQERNNALEAFLIEHAIMTKQPVTGQNRMSYGLEYVTAVPDAYIQALVKHIDAERGNDVKLHEIFIEYFLRTRIALKDIPIGETRYGRTVRRFMESQA
jgi:hypothetical protein